MPSFGLGAALLVSIVLFVIALRLWLRSRRAPDVLYSATIAAIAGSAVLFVALFVSGMRHYGGTQGDGSQAYTCAAWWQEAGLPSNAHGVDGDSSDRCRQWAIDAIEPAIFESGVAGIVGGAAVFGALSLALRRRSRSGTDNVEA